MNGFALAVVADMTLAELRSDALAPAVATNTARIVTLSNGVTLTCTTQVVGIVAGVQGMFAVATGGTATVVSPLLSRGISGVNAGETLNIIGAGDSTGCTANQAMIRGGGATNWTGNITNPIEYISDTIDGGTVNITGNILQNGGKGIWVRSNHTLSVTGGITNTNTPFYDTVTTTYNVFTHNGALTAGSSPVVRTRSPYRGSGPFINNGSIQALSSDRLELIGANTYFEVTTTVPSTVRLYTPSLLSGYPIEADVKDGVVYGVTSQFTGTLEVVDTEQLATDFFDAIIASSDPLAIRLKNTATVSTVNDAISSLNVIP